jgi:Na+-transporting methylmalonyl-CoA/oxaloacetate decarboxylase beta subunit
MKKVLSIVALIVGVLIILSFTVPTIIGIISTISSPSSSVGIIGGADGPTAIMIAKTANIGSIIIATITGALLIVAGILGLRKKK